MCIVQYFCFLGVSGTYSPTQRFRVPAGKGEKVRCVLAGAMAQGAGSGVIVLYFSSGTALCTALPGLPGKGDLDG